MHILVVDDDPLFAQTVVDALGDTGYQAEAVDNGHAALMHALRHHPDLLLLDLSLPDIDGRDLCQILRQHAVTVPIIFLTAHHALEEVIAGLDAGADDFITKPCHLGELLARVRTVLRRARSVAAAVPNRLTVNAVTVDTGRHTVCVRGESVLVSPKEFNLLWLLMANAGQVIPRARIIDTVWGTDFYGDVKALDVYIRLLRRKIEADSDHPRLIQTVRGVGYLFASSGANVQTDWPPDTRAAS